MCISTGYKWTKTFSEMLLFNFHSFVTPKLLSECDTGNGTQILTKFDISKSNSKLSCTIGAIRKRPIS